MNRIRGQHALITGATAGIGEACARALDAMGVRLTLIGRRGERLGEILMRETRGQVGCRALDVRDRAAIDALVDDLEAGGGPPVDILINNAGLSRGFDTVQDGRHEDWDEMIDTNIKGVLNMTRAFLPGMIERNRGHVVNLGSIAGHWTYPRGNVYCATKYAVRALSESINLDLEGTRVRMTSIDPGRVETEFSLVRFRGDEARAGAVYEGVESLTPDDVADAVCYALNAPERVNIRHLIMTPTDQRSPAPKPGLGGGK